MTLRMKLAALVGSGAVMGTIVEELGKAGILPGKQGLREAGGGLQQDGDCDHMRKYVKNFLPSPAGGRATVYKIKHFLRHETVDPKRPPSSGWRS